MADAAARDPHDELVETDARLARCAYDGAVLRDRLAVVERQVADAREEADRARTAAVEARRASDRSQRHLDALRRRLVVRLALRVAALFGPVVRLLRARRGPADDASPTEPRPALSGSAAPVPGPTAPVTGPSSGTGANRTDAVSSLPDLVIIGAQKSATRWLRDQLAQDPAVHMAEREVEFFNNHWDEGLEWYAQWFRPTPDVQVRGEATPGYLMWTDAPRRNALRIAGTLPEVRLVAVLRHPVDRAVSAYIHHARRGRIDSQSSLMDFLRPRDHETDHLGIVSGGWYGRSLQPYVELFEDRLLVLLQDRVATSPGDVLGQVAMHVGLAGITVPESARQVAHSNRSHVDVDVLDRARLTDEERAELWERHYAEDVELLRSLTTVAVDHWVPD